MLIIFNSRYSKLKNTFAYKYAGLAQKRQKLLYHRRKHGHSFEVGNRVWLHEEAVPRGN